MTSALAIHALSFQQVLCRGVFDLIHDPSHPCGYSMAKLLKQKLIWHSISNNMESWARSCIHCQSREVTRHTDSNITDSHPLSHQFAHILVDIISPLPSSESSQYLFTTIDRPTCWFEAVLKLEVSSSS